MLIRKISRNISSARYYSHFALENITNEENITRTLSNLKNINPSKSNSASSSRRAAVLIPICVVDGKTSLLYTLRTSHLNSHKGQVSFPGGKHDSADESLIHTALRETQEEIGINPDIVKVWGTGNSIDVRGSSILPVIGTLSEFELNNLNINRQEVEEVFCVSLEDLCDTSKIGHTQFRNHYSIPVFLGGKRKIWGITAIITYTFLKSLLPRHVYDHKIRYMQPFNIEKPKK